jgi:hypothetical protein
MRWLYSVACVIILSCTSGGPGLLWHVNAGTVIEVHRGWAVIDRPVNRSQRIFSRRDIDKNRVVLPWTLPLVKTE